MLVSTSSQVVICNYCCHMQVRFCFWMILSCLTFLFVRQISREPLSGFAKFTVKTCLVPRSDEFECEGQWSVWSGKKTVESSAFFSGAFFFGAVL